MTIRLNQVYGALAPLTEGNFQFGLNYGSGLGVSSGQLVNTGVLSLQGDTGSLSLGAGTGIGISGLTISNTGIISASAGSGISVSGTNPLTITNTGVLSLQGDTGALSLGAGTGIGISGLTISNTGIISASAGNGISVSGTNPLTITNTGVLSLQGDTGALSLSAGTGIGISGLTISNTGIISASAGNGISVSGTNPLTITNTGVLSLSSNGSLSLSGFTGSITIFLNTANPNIWSATQTIGALTVDDAVGGTPFTPNGNTAFAFYNGGYSSYVGNGEWLGFWRDNGNYFAPLLGEQNNSFIIAFANDSATANNGLNANSGTMAFEVEPSGAVYTGSNQNYVVPVSSGMSHNITVRNILDDGYGNMTVAGSGTFSLINANENDIYGSTGGHEIIALSGGLLPFPTAPTSGMYGLGISNDTLEVYTTTNINFWQLGFNVSTPAFSIGGADNAAGKYSIIKSAYNILDDGSGNMTVAGSGTFNFINANKNNTNGTSSGGTEIIALYGGLQSFPKETTGSMYGLGISLDTLEVYTNSNINFWQLSSSVSTPAFSIGGADSGGGTYSLIQSAHNTFDDGGGNMTIVGNEGIQLNSGAYGNYFWVYSEGVVGFFGNEGTTPIIDVGTNVNQQNANSNVLPQPNTSYGGGLFRLDLRTGNPSGLIGLKEAPQWYVLLQPSGTAGLGTPIFGVDVGGHISSKYNTFDDGSGNMTIYGNLTLLKYYNSATFTALYTTTNTSGINGNGVEGVYNTLTNSMHVNISASTISVFSIFGEYNNGGGTGVGVLLTSVSYSVASQISYGSPNIIAYFPAISTAGNTGDNLTTQTWIASGVASTNGTYYITIATQETCCSHYLEFNHTVITFP